MTCPACLGQPNVQTEDYFHPCDRCGGTGEIMDGELSLSEIAEMFCPTCGYYCNGKGGIGCIDKLGLYEKAALEAGGKK